MLPLLLHHWLCIIQELLMTLIILLRQIYGRVCEHENWFTHYGGFEIVCNEMNWDWF